MSKLKKEKIEDIEASEVIIDPEILEDKIPEISVNNELDELLSIHKALTVKGIRDIGQLEVLISRLQ